MKFTKIEIKDFQQFKDFELDLTYPVGHPKAGQPLEKVCFIGQSGTGKTTLLNLIKHLNFQSGKNITYGDNTAGLYKSPIVKSNNVLEVYGNIVKFELKFYKNFERDCNFEKFKPKEFYEIGISNSQELIGIFEESIGKIIYFPDNLRNEKNEIDPFLYNEEPRYFDFSQMDIFSVLKLLNSKIQSYHEKTIIFRDKLSKASESLDIDKIQNAVNEFNYWRSENPSPIDKIADNCLDKILKNFSLRVKREFVFEKKEDIGLIKVENMEGTEIPSNILSTGINRILLSASPLFLLNPENYIILFDEPENSLFPDIQRLIVDYYTSFTNDCQFFYATHSPIIASSFDPAERFILYFDETGKVKAKRGVAPKGDDSNDLLTKDFGLDTNLGIEGEIQFHNFISLKEKIRNETDNSVKAVLINEYMTIGKAYNFGYDLKVMEDEANYKKHQ